MLEATSFARAFCFEIDAICALHDDNGSDLYSTRLFIRSCEVVLECTCCTGFWPMLIEVNPAIDKTSVYPQ